MGDVRETFLGVLEATEFVAIATHGDTGPHLVGTWGEYVRRLGPSTETIIVPAGGYHQTERNLARDNRITLLIASRQVQGASGPGQACVLSGTAELVTRGPIAETVRSSFPWARGALVVTINEITLQL